MPCAQPAAQLHLPLSPGPHQNYVGRTSPRSLENVSGRVPVSQNPPWSPASNPLTRRKVPAMPPR